MSILLEVFHELTKELVSKRRAIRIQLMALLISFIGVAIGMSGLVIERATTQTKGYQEQISSLNETEQNLRQLIAFIETQKSKLAESQAVVKSLKDEESKLRPMVEADREIVDAILDAQNTRNRAHIWKERTISFLLGVIASIVAALVLTAVSRARKARRENVKTNPTSASS